jgi:serine phosphatase RsbU (regulator of sigma subunit)
MAVGIDPGDAFDEATGEGEIQLSDGDLLVLYTDGITEARDRAGSEFGRDNLIEAVATAGPKGAAELSSDIRERLRRFVGDTPQQDDITLLILGLNGHHGNGTSSR